MNYVKVNTPATRNDRSDMVKLATLIQQDNMTFARLQMDRMQLTDAQKAAVMVARDMLRNK
nr:MAG TPA: hypothetical protein [Caudoviricetes sp.]